jgi:hypothetical protein
MSNKRKSRSRRARLIRSWFDTGRRLSATTVGIARRTLARMYRRLRPHGPTVIIDARRRHARRLRREIARAARTYAAALGAELPKGLVVIVQRVVHQGRQINGLLQAFDGSSGRRYVIHLALSVNGRQVAEDELLSALRHQVASVLGDSVGHPALTIPLDLEVPRMRAGAPVVELRPDTRMPEDGHERGAIPIERIEDKVS